MYPSHSARSASSAPATAAAAEVAAMALHDGRRVGWLDPKHSYCESWRCIARTACCAACSGCMLTPC